MKQHCGYESTFYGNLTQAINWGGGELQLRKCYHHIAFWCIIKINGW